MEFIKKNMALVLVLAVTGLVSAYLIYMDWRKQDAVIKANADVTNLKGQIEELVKKSPAPVADNLDMIRKDTAVMREKAQDLQRLFGKPLRLPLMKFAEALGLTEYEVAIKFRDHCVSNPKEQDKGKLLDSFVKSFGDEKAAAAILAFKKSAQEHMLEEIVDSNIKVVLLQALSVPRTMSPSSCKEYIVKTQELFAKAYAPLITNDTVSKLTLIDYASRVPAHDEIPLIIRKLQLFEDLFGRLRDSGVSQLNSVEMLGSIMGDEVAKDYLKFSYRLKVTGEMQKIKNFVNLLQEAYKDNRVYSVKDIALQTAVDDTTKMDRTSVGSPRIIPNVRRGDSKDKDLADKEVPFEERPEYGQPVIGSSKLVNADIELDYFIFVGDELKH